VHLHPSQGGYRLRGSPPQQPAVSTRLLFTIRPPLASVAQRERVAPNGRRPREPVHRRGGQGWTSRPMTRVREVLAEQERDRTPRSQNAVGPSEDGPGEDLRGGAHLELTLSFSPKWGHAVHDSLYVFLTPRLYRSPF